MSEYEINKDTFAILPIGKTQSRIIEKDHTFIVNVTPMQIISDNCSYFGSSYNGRFSRTKKLIGVSHKAPIIIAAKIINDISPIDPEIDLPTVMEIPWDELKEIINEDKINIELSLIGVNGNI